MTNQTTEQKSNELRKKRKRRPRPSRASRKAKSKKFLSNTFHKAWLFISGNIKNPSFKQKAWLTTKYLFEVTITGLLAWYALHHPTSIIGIAIIIAMTAYYVEWLITLIKKPYENQKEE